MRHRLLILILAGAMTLGMPAATAQWGAKGVMEPDTAADTADGYMWPDAPRNPADETKRVYFNGFPAGYYGYSAGVTTTVNPTSAAEGSRFLSYPYRAMAMLGVWRDCNRDGYIGYGDNGLMEYPTALLPANHICPAGPHPESANYVPQHHDGEWVREFLPVGNLSINADNPYAFQDNRSRVWADWNKPSEAPHPICPVDPQPRGTFQSTGGFLRYADCFADWRITGAINVIAYGIDQPGLAFNDSAQNRPHESNSPLNRPNPWGQPNDAAYATAIDCEAPPTVVDDPTRAYNGSSLLYRVDVYRPGASTPVTVQTGQYTGFGADGKRTFFSPGVGTNAGGSPAGTINATDAGADDCDRDANGGPRGGNIYPTLGEADHEGAQPLGRTETDHSLAFNPGTRSQNITSANGGMQNPLGRGAPGNGQLTGISGFWVGDSVTGVSRNPYVHRAELQPEKVIYISYYAYVSQAAIDRWGFNVKASEYGTYGSDACTAGFGAGPANSPTFPSNVQNGWECNPDLWWRDPTNATRSIMPTGTGVTLEQPFNFRDIDCHDQSISKLRALGVTWGRLSNTVCV